MTALVSPSLGGANVTLTLPSNDGDTNQVLITDGSGNLSFSSVSAAILQLLQQVYQTL